MRLNFGICSLVAGGLFFIQFSKSRPKTTWKREEAASRTYWTKHFYRCHIQLRYIAIVETPITPIMCKRTFYVESSDTSEQRKRFLLYT